MTNARPPQQVSYIIHAGGVEEYALKKEKPGLSGLLGRVFGPSAGGALSGGRHAAVAEEQGVFDHSSIPLVLARLEELKKRQKECLDDIVSRHERMQGYEYKRSECIYVMVGPTSKLQAGARPKFYPGDAFRFEGADITAENLAAALTRCDSAETRAMALEQAIAPATAVKKMKPLHFKKSV